MASTYGSSKFLGTVLQSLARSCQRSAKIINWNRRLYLPFQSARLLRHNTGPAITRSISAIQPEHASSCTQTWLDSQHAEKDKHNSLVLDDQQKRDTLVEKVKTAISTDLPFGRIFAIVHIGGKQFKITSNDIIMIHKMAAKCGDKIRLRKILAIGGREFSLVGKPLLSHEHVHIEATVLEKTKGRNVIIFKKKRRKNYKKWKEHRQDVTVLRINKILINPEIVE